MTSARGVLSFIQEVHSYSSTLPSSLYSYPGKTENPTLTTAHTQGANSEGLSQETSSAP